MIWRESLPARVALLTAGLLALLTLAGTSVAYIITALLLRQGVDAALAAALPARTNTLEELLGEVAQSDDDDWEPRRFQVLTPNGVVTYRHGTLPVDPEAVRLAQRDGQAFLSLVPDIGGQSWRPRTGPDWWQALTPAEDELRVMYAQVAYGDRNAVLQLAAPLGAVGEVLPDLLKALLILVCVEVLLSGLVAWRMAAGLYRPLRVVTATAADISTRTPGLRIPQLWPDRTLRRLIGVLNDMVARLQEAYEAQGRFVAAAAHELRSPLAAMRAELEVALRRERSPSEYRAALQGALEETVRLAALAEHLLILARYERGASLAMERDIPVAPLLERAAEEIRRATGGDVVVDAPQDLEVDGDSLALELLVTNLVRNAIEAGGAPVRVAAAAADGGVAIHVRDQGPGIPPDALPRIFEPFYRIDPARRRGGGAGLGLAIVKTVVDAHGGRIEVESRPGKGTAFHVWIPRRQSPATS